MQKKREENSDSYGPICLVANLCYMLILNKAPNDNISIFYFIIVKFQETWMPKRKPKKKDWSTVCPLFWGNFRPRNKSKQKCYGTGW